MGLPTIDPYPLPAADDLPEGRVHWRLDPDRAVLLVHDMQRYFLAPFASEEPPLPAVIANIARLRRRADELALPVVFTAQPGNQATGDRALLTDFWGPGLADDPAQTAVIDDLAPSADDVVLTKWRYSAFQRTDLEARMREAGRDQLIVTGVYAHIGCQTTATEAFQRDIQAFLVADGVADFSRADHDDAVSWVARRCGRVLSSVDALDELAAVGRSLQGKPAG